MFFAKNFHECEYFWTFVFWFDCAMSNKPKKDSRMQNMSSGRSLEVNDIVDPRYLHKWENFHQNDEKWFFSKGFKIDPGGFQKWFWSVRRSILKIPTSENDQNEKFKIFENLALKRRKMKKMRCSKPNFLSQRWKNIESLRHPRLEKQKS